MSNLQKVMYPCNICNHRKGCKVREPWGHSGGTSNSDDCADNYTAARQELDGYMKPEKAGIRIPR